jgi:hypothetical protein
MAVKLNRKGFEFAKELVGERKADCAKVNSADPREALACATGSSAGV